MSKAEMSGKAKKVSMFLSYILWIAFIISLCALGLWDYYTYGPRWLPEERAKKVAEVERKEERIPQRLQKALATTFVDNGGGTITDTKTELMWQKHGWGPAAGLEQAKQYARNLRLGNFCDWRLPNSNELLTLYDNLGPAVEGSQDRRIKPFSWPGNNYLASGEFLWHGNARGFNDGSRFWPKASSPPRTYVRAVRGLNQLPKEIATVYTAPSPGTSEETSGGREGHQPASPGEKKQEINLWPFGPTGWICKHIYPSAYTETERNFWNAIGGG